jgi:hypothetical protein
MGFGIGIGIGWGARGNSPAVLGYFIIAGRCDGAVAKKSSTQLVNTSIYYTGNYVDGVDGGGNTSRFLLGEMVPVPGDNIVEISGPTYISCEE